MPHASVTQPLKPPKSKPKTYIKRSTGVEQLTDDLTGADIVWVLEHLRFETEHRLVSLDLGCRDYLVRAVRSLCR